MANALDKFQADLDRIADLTDEELTTLESGLSSAFDEADNAADEAAMNDLADAMEKVRTEMENRSKKKDKDADSADNSADADANAPTTASAHEKEDTDVSNGIPKDRMPLVEETTSHAVVTAAADLPGFTAGTEFKNMGEFAQAFTKRIGTLKHLSRKGSDGEKVIVASIQNEAPEDRILRSGDREGNFEKIQAVTSPQAVTASGGFCAPLTTRYDLFTIGDTSRPVRDSLVSFQADRGGIRYFAGPSLPTITKATGLWGTEEDAGYKSDDESTWKILGEVECPTEAEAYTSAVTMALKFGVQGARVFPENVTANTQVAMVQHARLAESNLLAQIKNKSEKMAGPVAKYGAVRDLLLTVAQVGAWYRDRNRLDKNTVLRAILPLWIVEALRADIIIQPPAGDGRAADFGISATDIENFFDQWGVKITWTLDGYNPAVNAGGNYGAATANVPAFPTTLEWALFAEGSFLFLDGGNLDLGIIRDGNLARANDYIQFSETFEGVAKVGGEALWLTSPVNILGGYSSAIAAPAGA